MAILVAKKLWPHRGCPWEDGEAKFNAFMVVAETIFGHTLSRVTTRRWTTVPWCNVNKIQICLYKIHVPRLNSSSYVKNASSGEAIWGIHMQMFPGNLF